MPHTPTTELKTQLIHILTQPETTSAPLAPEHFDAFLQRIAAYIDISSLIDHLGEYDANPKKFQYFVWSETTFSETAEFSLRLKLFFEVLALLRQHDVSAQSIFELLCENLPSGY